MESRTGTNSIWVLVILVLALIGLLPNLPGVVALSASATSASALATPTAGAVTADFDEQQATDDLEAQVFAVYNAASSSIVNISSRV